MYPDVIILLLPLLDAAVIFAALRAAGRCRDAPSLRNFWLLIALAWAAEVFADGLLVLNDVVLDHPRFPSFADAFFLAFYPLLLLAISRAPRAGETRSGLVRVSLDSALVVLGGGTAIWYFVLGPTIEGGGQGALATAVSLAYPLGDLAALSALAVVMLRRTDRRLQGPLLWVGAGLLMLVVADTAYGYSLAQESYAPGDPVDLLYVLLTLPFLLAAVTQRPASSVPDLPSEAQRGHIASPLPYIGMAVSFSFLLWVEWGDRFFPDFSLLLMAGAVALVAAMRQLLTQREQSRLAAALRESETLFRGIYTNTGIGIAISSFADGHPSILDVNPAFTRMTGYSAEELRGGDFSAITPPEHLESLEQMREAVRTGKEVIGREQPFLRKDGAVSYGSLTVSVMRDEAGAPRMLVGAIEDISERKAAERAKDEFVSIVGHELRTPLTSIRGSLGLIQGGVVGGVSGEAAAMIDTAVASSDRLVRLINDTLDLERMESGLIDLRVAPVRARDLIDQAVGEVEALADAAEVELEAEVPDLYLDVDGDRIVQALDNLLANAIKFSAPGQMVSVGIHAEGEQARVSVLDHGRGIPPEQLEAIFERFSQVDASDSREKGGTGLGLAIARQIVEGHGGQIWAESSPAYGTRIQFTVPLAPVPAELVR